MDERMRADAALKARGLAASRERAQALISAGLVTVNGRAIEKPARKVGPADILEVLGSVHPYVGRGGLKLEKALSAFGIAPAGQVCMDIGASTGGFTDVLLRNGAARVYAIDVGAGQLDPSLQADERVVSMEKVNARALTPDMFAQRPTLAVMDVSFISIKLILPAALAVLGAGGRLVSLVKPQFEAGRDRLGKGGLVTSARTHGAVLRDLVDFVPALGWRVRALDFSPVAGGSGNLEFLADLVAGDRCDALLSDRDIERVVRQAHEAVR